MNLVDLPFDCIIEIARTSWMVWYKLSIALREFGLYSIIPSVRKAAQSHFCYDFYCYKPYEGCELRYYAMGTKFHGVFEDYNTKSNVSRRVLNYYNGMKDGECIHYFPNSSIKSIGIYKNDELHGVSHFFSNDGVLTSEVNFEKGMKHGRCIEYFHTGKVKRIQNFVQNQKHGTDVQYFESGQINTLNTFQDGYEHGIFQTFYENGQLNQESHHFLGYNDKTLKVYFMNGFPKMTITYEKNKHSGAYRNTESIWILDRAYSVTIYSSKEKDKVLRHANKESKQSKWIELRADVMMNRVRYE